MPGGFATSSATTSSRPCVAKTSTAYSCSLPQCRCISCSADTSCAHRLSPTLVTVVPSSTLNEPPSDISTARTTAWSPPTRACETVLVGAFDGPTATGAEALTGGLNFARARFLLFRLTSQVLQAEAY